MEYKADSLMLRTVTTADIAEVARTWPSAHCPISEAEAEREIARMEQSREKNRDGHIHHLCLAACMAEVPQTIMGWCGLDGGRSPEEPEIFVLLDREFRGKGYGTQCIKLLLKIAAAGYGLRSVHGGCRKDNIASKRAMEKAGMVQYGQEENGDPLFRFRPDSNAVEGI